MIKKIKDGIFDKFKFHLKILLKLAKLKAIMCTHIDIDRVKIFTLMIYITIAKGRRIN